MGAVHATVLGENISHAPGDLAADGHTPVSILHMAALDHDVLAGHGDAPAVGISAGFDRDAIVAGVEVAVLDQHVGAGLRIAAIRVGSSIVLGAGGGDRHLAHCDIRAQHWMNLPHRRVFQRHALDQQILATIGLNKLWPQIMSRPEHALGHGYHSLRHVKEQVAVFDLVRLALLPSTMRAPLPWPPMLTIGIAINGALTGDRDVSLLKGVDERRIVHQLNAFPSREHKRVLPGIAAEADGRPGQQMQVDLALQMNRSGHELAGRNHDSAASGAVAGRYRLLERVGAIRAVVSDGAESGYVAIAIRKNRRLDTRENL